MRSTNIDEDTLHVKIPSGRPEVRAAVAAYVQQVVTDCSNEVVSITLYGSQAREEASQESDIDLFIVVHRDTPALRKRLSDLAWQVQFQHDVVISDVIRSEDQLSRMQSMRFPYYRNIEQEGILLWKSQSRPTLAYA
jgi:hypothetical protein